MTDDQITTARQYFRNLLHLIDTDPNREGLTDTPRRWVKMMDEFARPEPFTVTTFASEGYDQMIVQTDIDFYSLCEHHVVPFFGHATVAYIPKDRIVGLSKLSRTVDHFARRLQNQERLTQQVADFLQEQLDPVGVAVSMRARHMCQEMRGVRKPETWTTTTCLKGALQEGTARAEFLAYLRP